MYAYEVDGLGHSLTDFDDPNLPSLLAIPLMGYDQYDSQVCFVGYMHLISIPLKCETARSIHQPILGAG
jgi:meiotically up-regulated gene 157 (Mug157) protein